MRAAVRDMVQVDEDRVYLGGFSGGACTAYQFAVESPELYRGAIVACGHAGPWRRIRGSTTGSARTSFYLFTRDDDFNRPATQTLHAEMASKGYRVTYVEHSGQHHAMNEQEAEEAIHWLDRGT